MTDFFEALFVNNNSFIRFSLYAGILASIAFGISGTYVVTRRISYIAGAISHCVLGGIGLALYLNKQYKLDWIDPIYGALFSALIAAFIIGLVNLYEKQKEDTIIGALWAVGMSIGIIFIKITPGNTDLTSYLFGSILIISQTDLIIIAVLDVIVLFLCVLFYNKFLALCFDEEFSELRGINVKYLYILLLCIIAITVILLVQVVGIVMVIALLTLPAAISENISSKLWKIMLLATLFCMIFTISGLALSYSLELLTGPTIILIASTTYLLIMLSKKILSSRKTEKTKNI